ncbi:MAG: helix-turn-helix transcriptional regulator [Alteromonadales bacterium]|nr:helix-turn-helix transcriptional regulator [Alteromonadales bacterium]
MHNLNPEYVLRALRGKIKENDLTYAQLAESMEIPLSTLKRHLHSSSITLDKLVEYCKMVGLSIEELIQSARLLQLQNDTLFTRTQDEVFYKFPEVYDFFQEIRVTPNDISAIVENYQLDASSTYAYLRSLEMIGLITLLPNNRFYLRGPCHYRFSDDSKLSFMFDKRLKKRVLAHPKKATLSCSRMFLTKECIAEIEALITNKILESNTINTNSGEHDDLSSDLRHDVVLMITPYKPLLFSNGICNQPKDFLFQIRETIEKFERVNLHSN